MITRNEVIKLIMNKITEEDLIISTTGMISREIYSCNDRKANFYMIGSMGLASSFAAGIAISNPEKNVVIFDGDGSFLMNMGATACIGYYSPANLTHIVLDNYSYQSTGAQPSISKGIDICSIAIASGYRSAIDFNEFQESDLASINIAKDSLALYRIHVKNENTHNIPRVSHLPKDITNNFKSLL